MARALWTEAARADLRSILLEIAEGSGRRAVAKRLGREIRAEARLRAGIPLGGQTYPELGPGCRGFTFRRWLVVYIPRDDGIEILAVVDGARDFGQVVRGRTSEP
ncbi:MAG: plasmid stabilization protein [Planctomycetaceae bacterium]|nr:plasmid stabilization protein [Planctomycetaceae bacterium]